MMWCYTTARPGYNIAEQHEGITAAQYIMSNCSLMHYDLGRTREEERWLVQTVKTCSGKPICLLINRFLQVAAGAIRTDVFRQ